MTEEVEVHDKYLLPRMRSVERISKLPAVEQTVDLANNIYTRVKDTNNLVRSVLSTAETTVKGAVDITLPVTAKLEGPIKMMDSLLCSSLDYVETKIPAVKLPLDEIPSHCGFEGNEIADLLAKRGSQEALTGPEPALGIPKSMVREAMWNSKCHKSLLFNQKGCWHGKLFITGPSAQLSNLVLGRPRTFTRVLVDHLPVREHLHRLGLYNGNIRCRICKEDPETVAVLLHAGDNKIGIQRLLGGFEHPIPMYKNTRDSLYTIPGVKCACQAGEQGVKKAVEIAYGASQYGTQKLKDVKDILTQPPQNSDDTKNSLAVQYSQAAKRLFSLLISWLWISKPHFPDRRPLSSAGENALNDKKESEAHKGLNSSGYSSGVFLGAEKENHIPNHTKSE